LTLVRIVLAGLPALLRDITNEVISGEPWAEVVAAYDQPVPLGTAVSENRAHVILVADKPGVESEARALLESTRSVGVLVLSENAHESVVYALRPNREPLGEVSAERLVNAIRGAVSPAIEA
jgi:hypothetical protein